MGCWVLRWRRLEQRCLVMLPWLPSAQGYSEQRCLLLLEAVGIEWQGWVWWRQEHSRQALLEFGLNICEAQKAPQASSEGAVQCTLALET